ncbi:ABC transporter ATP-binding protein [Clostridium oryzae]|uniref:Taurine import ATP-binding protein TauB n=1 Tax=Clostridium oryzae TaxID=1450648 RepID=A0A1V4IKL6_9CLOT|nr:ABC transporter ATP-binding protein [Clostridium oryzae]OPJ60374.1 taurine import ATP-binding protein TauB [Clostridium oryzae]
MNMLELKNIYMNYHSKLGETRALENINIKVEKGEFISIVGPSGCGKSTLLNIISGLQKPSQGEVFIENVKVSGHCDKLGYMFQNDNLFQWLNVWQNVALGLRISHNLNKENMEKLDVLLKNYGLWDFRNHKPSELSGGMRQRVALIRTLAMEPEVLLLDEPFSALDYQTRLNVSNEIYKIIKHEGKTAVMVTHDISEAISTSSKVVILSSRPAKIKKIIDISFENKYSTPLSRREAPEFRLYFNSIWKELEFDDRE